MSVTEIFDNLFSDSHLEMISFVTLIFNFCKNTVTDNCIIWARHEIWHVSVFHLTSSFQKWQESNLHMISLLKALSMIIFNNFFCKSYFLTILYKYLLRIWSLCSSLMISKTIVIFWNFQLSFTKYAITLKNNNWFELDHTSIISKIFQFFERLWQISDSISLAQLSISSVKTIHFEMFKLN